MARGRAKRKTDRRCVDELAALIEGLTSEQAIALGALRDDLPDEISIVTKAALANGVPPTAPSPEPATTSSTGRAGPRWRCLITTPRA